MNDSELKLLNEVFKKYYFNNFKLIQTLHRTSEREFGFQKFNFGMKRHLSFKTDKELHLMLMTEVPSDVYCSNAYYTFPNLPMAEKDWTEADLIFDIDAKDLNLSCREKHVCGKCNSCNHISVGKTRCNSCSSTKLDYVSLPCNKCIDGTKKELDKLVSILCDDLDLKRELIQIYFSGNEGFHVHVAPSQYNFLSSKSRSEIVDYIMFKGILPETLGFKKFKPSKSNFADFAENGWRGRISKELYGTKSKRSKEITLLLNEGYVKFQKRLDILKGPVGVKIDPNVTMDIHRIFRLPGSINSKSGLSKVLCNDITKFEPFTDACMLDDSPVQVFANSPLEFSLKGKKFGPYENESVTVPKFAAIYMICKKLAALS